MTWIQTSSEGVTLNLRIVPRASKNEISGTLGDALKIRLQAPPVEGKANEALVKFLAETLDLPTRNVRLLAGATGRNKRVFVQGLTESVIRKRLYT